MPRERRRDEGQATESVDALYGLPLERFVSERDELARRLRGEGRREDAARVAKLPKPALAAWGANQALRSQPAAARELRAAGKALAETQTAALQGRSSRGELHGAVERHRVALERLVEAARGLLDGKGRSLSAPTVEHVAQTLNAASLDPSLAEEAEQARLEREHFYTGFEELLPAGEMKRARKQPPSRPSGHTAKTGMVTARERRERDAARKRRAAQIKAARMRLNEARKRTTTAAKARDAAARRAEAAAAGYDKAKQVHAEALEQQASAQSDLDALLRDGE